MTDNINLIKDLRAKTGAGFLDCKNALNESNNDIEIAIDYLRKKGLAKATKKSNRDANEGAIGVFKNDKLLVVLKINTETDFAAKSETFLSFINTLGEVALNHGDHKLDKDTFLNLSIDNKNVSDFFTEMIAKIGENLILNDISIFDNQKYSTSFYVHNSYKDNIGKIVSVIQYQSDDQNNEILNFAKNLCMHIAAMKPLSLDKDDLDQELISKEKNIQHELIVSSGKPTNIIDKIIDGKMNKYFADVTLLNQKFVLDNDKSVKEVINDFKKKNSFNLISFNLKSLT